MILPRFYPIFDNADWIARALPLGVRMVQLRVKDRDPREDILRARDLCRDAGAILVVNDHWELALDLNCDWVHLGQEDLDTADLPALRHRLRLGISTHDQAELDRALACRPDYIALGPVWPTILKKMKWERQGVGKLTEWKAKIGAIPLIAIGGLTPDRAVEAFGAGADVASAVTDITLNPDPEARMRDWLRVCG
ncbi:thiamine phosphate synthase [Falsirhodobacter halotolerans]|uniref:thiamine phosphate synthase n=1 Tax=Falsirhodobacter halotolerans TaxID=1146892 RepID=UPI001FD0A177|nr:thiamine phosphate synthase [Falsirhodobacter halotolerans]